MTTSRKTWLVGALFALTITQPASATTIADNYWGGNPSENPSVPTTQDRIGDVNVFEVSSADVSIR